MSSIFVLEDALDAESMGKFDSFEAAWAEIRRLASLPWDAPPNVAPCQSWETCGRDYEIVECDTSCEPWEEIRRISAFEINAAGVKWPSSDDGA